MVRSLLRRLAELAGIPVGPRARQLASNLAYLVGTDLALTALTFGLTAALVRALGPAAFGQVNLATSVAQLWVILLLAGMHVALTRHVAAEPARAPTIVGSALAIAGIMCLAAPPVIVATRDLTMPLLRVDLPVFLWSLALALGLVPHALANGILAGQQRFREVSRFNLAAGLVFALLVGVLLAGVWAVTFERVVLVNALRAVVFAVLAFHAARGVIGRPSPTWARRLFGFGGYYTLAAFAHFLILGSIDNLMLNAYLGPAAVGLYSAYYVPFNLFTSRIVKLISDVLMPAAAAHEDRARLLRQVLGAYARGAWLIIPGVMAATFALFWVYGGAFEFRWTLAFLMGCNVWLHATSTVMGDLLVADGTRGVRWSMYGAFVTAIVNVTANLLLIPTFGVAGTMLASVAAFMTAIAVRAFALSRLH